MARRRRALAAARAATFGLGCAALGCGGGEVADGGADLARRADLAVAVDQARSPDLAAPDLAVVDLAVPDLAPPDLAARFDLARLDGPRDGGADLRDGGGSGARDLAGFDGVCPPGGNPGTDPDCCVAAGGFWIDGACAVPGPFVPPRESGVAV